MKVTVGKVYPKDQECKKQITMLWSLNKSPCVQVSWQSNIFVSLPFCCVASPAFLLPHPTLSGFSARVCSSCGWSNVESPTRRTCIHPMNVNQIQLQWPHQQASVFCRFTLWNHEPFREKIPSWPQLHSPRSESESACPPTLRSSERVDWQHELSQMQCLVCNYRNRTSEWSHLRMVPPEFIQNPKDVQFPLIAVCKGLQNLVEPERDKKCVHCYLPEERHLSILQALIRSQWSVLLAITGSVCEQKEREHGASRWQACVGFGRRYSLGQGTEGMTERLRSQMEQRLQEHFNL